ncbi:osteoclast stimulatory transmembrane protein [Vombatus ursinus]|uniref:Dendritic cell-specific transmembrane protein-like domain-containing protein n=1 Tax=Vombatus ursinus TaxID=29139 RepID=A0A4X2JQJ6_VOMUR|nr:osteoclast stimulatory transmembrane protein [Vombatus ursinus]
MRNLQGTEECLVRIRRWLWHSGLPKAQALLLAAWEVYSKPVPASCGQLLIQLLLCALIAGAAGGLAYNWLTASLVYSVRTSVTGAMTCGFLLFLALGLVHPARCLLAVTVPTLGTRQGRRLLLSSGFAELATHVVPNILANVGATTQVLRCVAQGSLESLLNSTHQLEAATVALHQAAGRAGGRGLTLETTSNRSALYLQMLVATQRVFEDVSALEALVQGLTLGTNRVLAGVFILSLLSESTWYLKGYLTDLQFDNLYHSKQLKQLLRESQDSPVLASPPALVLRTTGLKLSRAEIFHCLFHLAFLGMPLGAMAVTVAADYVAFLLASTAVDWAQKLPTLPIHLSIKYDAKYTVLAFISFIFNQPSEERSLDTYQDTYKWELCFTSASCQLHPAHPPQYTAALAAGTLFLFASATVFLETYARRLGHRVAASFFQAQEEQRARYLFARLHRSHQKSQVESIHA